MSWAVTPFAVKEPQLVESLMLAFGKSLYLACEFERKCQYVLRILNLAEMAKVTDDASTILAAAAAAKDCLLHQTINGIRKINAVTREEIDDLCKARLARNYIAHESGKIGSFHNLKDRHIAEVFSTLRLAVIDLAKGDNVISIWDFEIQEKLAAPEWMIEAYEERVLNWIFGEPFRGISSSDEWALRQMSRPSY